MKRRHWKLAGMVVFVGAIVCVMTYAGKKGKEKKASLPAAVKQVITQNYPGAKIEKVEKEDEGPVIYEVELKLADGSALEVMVATDGTLMEEENEIKPESLPNAVLAALPQSAKITEAEQQIIHAVLKPVKLDQPQTMYEVAVLLNGKEVEFEVAPDGTIVSKKVEDEDDGDDDDDDDDDDDEDDDEEDEDEEEVTLDEVPAAVKATILAEAQGGTIEEIELGNENGKTIYEAEVIINGQEVEIKIASDGTLLEKEVEDGDDDDEDDDDDDK